MNRVWTTFSEIFLHFRGPEVRTLRDQLSVLKTKNTQLLSETKTLNDENIVLRGDLSQQRELVASYVRQVYDINRDNQQLQGQVEVYRKNIDSLAQRSSDTSLQVLGGEVRYLQAGIQELNSALALQLAVGAATAKLLEKSQDEVLRLAGAVKTSDEANKQLTSEVERLHAEGSKKDARIAELERLVVSLHDGTS